MSGKKKKNIENTYATFIIYNPTGSAHKEYGRRRRCCGYGRDRRNSRFWLPAHIHTLFDDIKGMEAVVSETISKIKNLGGKNYEDEEFIKKALVLAGAMVIGGAMTAQAAGWQKNDTGWWYDNGDGTRPSNGWQWIDGDGDNIAECYYFDENGYILTSIVTPDGYIVNANGAWVENRSVQTKVVDVSKTSGDTYDVRDYDSQGISKAAVDILLHTKEENKKYGEAGTLYGTQILYSNGLRAEYDDSEDGRPARVRSDDDSTRIINQTIHQTRESAEALKAKRYDVSYGATLSIEGFWNNRRSFSMSGISYGTEASQLRLRGNGMEDWANWGTEWGY